MKCKADPCDSMHCAMANSYVQQLLGFSKTITDRVTLVMAVLKELDELDLVPAGFMRLAQCRVEVDDARGRLEVAQLEGAEVPRLEVLEGEVEDAERRYDTRLQEVVAHANAPDPN